MNTEPYLRRIRHEFPDLKFKKVRVPVQGMDHVALILDEKWVFRFPRTSKYLKLFIKEVHLLETLHNRLSLPIPHYERIASDSSFGGYSLIKGKPLQLQTFKKCTLRAKQKIHTQMARFLTELHTTPPNILKKYAVSAFKPGKELSRSRGQYHKYIESTLNQQDRKKCEEYFRQRKNRLADTYTPAFTHGDLSTDHILISTEHNEIAGIIDFSDRVIFDPAFDFTHLWDYGKHFMDGLYSEYAGPKDEHFLERSYLYYQQTSLNGLRHAIRGTYGTYKEAYRFFKAVF